MGVSANLLINSRHNIGAIEALLSDGLGIEIKEIEYLKDHAFIRFKMEGQNRQLYVAKSSEYGGVEGVILSMGSDENSIDLLKKIAKVTGGFLQEYDTVETWQSFSDPHAGMARFCFERGIMKNAISDADILADDVAEASGYERRHRKAK